MRLMSGLRDLPLMIAILTMVKMTWWDMLQSGRRRAAAELLLALAPARAERSAAVPDGVWELAECLRAGETARLRCVF